MNTLYLERENNGRIAYDSQGSGQLVVCVPGMGDLRAEYRFLTPQLVTAGYRVVTMDVRAHGESSTAWKDFSVAGIGSDVLALIRELNAGPAIVIGTSMAAGAAVWAAAEAPRLVAGIVLIGPAVRGETNWSGRLLYAALFSRPWGAAAWKMYFSTLYPTHKPDDFEQYTRSLVANLKEKGRLEGLYRMMLASKAASAERLEKVKVPALVLMGTKDPDFKDPEAEARLVAGKLGAEYHMIPGAGHYPHAEMTEVVVPLALPFLQKARCDA